VCGYGYAGRTAARELIARGELPERIVIVELRADRLEAAAASGHIGIRGDATAEETMKEACVARARAILVSLSRDDTTVLAILTARSLNERTRVIALCQDEENVKLLRKAGADEVVSPSRIGGFLAADAVSSRYATRFFSDILTARGGELRMAERRALADEIGRRMADVPGRLIVGLERSGQVLGFWNAPETVIRAEDLVFAIEARPPEASG
jgi:voltage-gated potassium channel